MNRNRVGAERIDDQHTEPCARLLRQTQACVANHYPRPNGTLGQITEILRIARDSLYERIDLEECPVLAWLRITENRSGTQSNCRDSLPVQMTVQRCEQLANGT